MFGIPIPSLQAIKLAAIGVAALAIAAGGFYAGYRWELGAYEARVAADAQALTKATQKAATKQHAIDLGNQDDAVAQAYFDGKMAGTKIQLKLEAPANVTFTQDNQAAASDHAGCITFGFVRLLAAGERGIAPNSLDYPGGESADTCSALEPSELAAALAQDLAAGTSDAHQLDSLIAAVKRNDGIAASP